MSSWKVFGQQGIAQAGSRKVRRPTRVALPPPIGRGRGEGSPGQRPPHESRHPPTSTVPSAPAAACSRLRRTGVAFREKEHTNSFGSTVRIARSRSARRSSVSTARCPTCAANRIKIIPFPHDLRRLSRDEVKVAGKTPQKTAGPARKRDANCCPCQSQGSRHLRSPCSRAPPEAISFGSARRP